MDGSSITDITGYRIDYGTSASALTLSRTVSGSGATSVTFLGLAPGTYYFAVSTLNSSGQASDPSSVVSKTVP